MLAKVRQVRLVAECGYQPELVDVLLPQTFLTDRIQFGELQIAHHIHHLLCRSLGHSVPGPAVCGAQVAVILVLGPSVDLISGLCLTSNDNHTRAGCRNKIRVSLKICTCM